MDLYSDDEIKIIISSILRHGDKSIVNEPYDELLKDTDVIEIYIKSIDKSL